MAVKVLGGSYSATFSIVLKQLWNAYKDGLSHGNDFAISKMKKYEAALEESYNRDITAKETEETGIVEMHYSEYKNNYSHCATVSGSYNKRMKTIKVYVNSVKAGTVTSRSNMLYHNDCSDGRCPKCHSWCYGDCEAV